MLRFEKLIPQLRKKMQLSKYGAWEIHKLSAVLIKQKNPNWDRVLNTQVASFEYNPCLWLFSGACSMNFINIKIRRDHYIYTVQEWATYGQWQHGSVAWTPSLLCTMQSSDTSPIPSTAPKLNAAIAALPSLCQAAFPCCQM